MPDTRIFDIVEQTIDLAVGENIVDDVVGQPIIPWMARAHSVIPPWWSFERDAYLRDFWKKSSHLSLMMYTAQTLLANTPMQVEAKDPSITSHVDQAEMFTELLWKASEFGETLFAAKAKLAEDYLAQDNGGFLEVIGDGRADGPIIGPPLAVRHLDAKYCYRTRNPIFPVVYHDPNDGGKSYKLHTTRVIAMSQMTSTEVLRNGVGFSAVSRSLQFAQHLYDIYIYKQEKLGSRPVSSIVVGSGFRGSHIMQAVKTANEAMSNMNLSRYSRVVGIGSDDTEAKLTKIDLNDFDPFDEEISITFAIYGMAAAFGVPIQEVWPTSSRGGRSGDMQESRQRGKLPAEFNAYLSMQLSKKYLPPYLRVVADWHDDYQDERRAVNQDIRARNRERDLGNGSVTISTARAQMIEIGDLSRDQYISMELEGGRLGNGTPIGSLFYEKAPPYKKLLSFDGVEYPTAIKANEKEEMLIAIDERLGEVHKEMAGVTSPRNVKKLKQCEAALNWLSEEYELHGLNPLPEELAFNAGVPGRGDPNIKPEQALAGFQAGQQAKPAASEKPEDDEKPEKKPVSSLRAPNESREGTVEKQVNDSLFLEFLITMQRDLTKEFDKDNPSSSKIKEIVIGWLLFAYLDGIDRSEDDLIASERNDIKAQSDSFVNQLDTIMDRKAAGNDMVGTVDRLVSQASGLFWLGFVKSDNQGEKLIWNLGSTKEHCGDCSSFAGKSKTKAEWRKGGKLPQSMMLECTGRFCLCHLSRDKR